MAQGTASKIVQDKNGKDTFGGHLYGTCDYYGPTLYVQGGDTVDPRIFGFPNSIFTLIGSVDQSNTYRLEPRKLHNGYSQWQLVWIVMATGVEAAANTVLTTFVGSLSAIGT